MGNTLPLSAHVDTASLVSFFVFLAIFGRIVRSVVVWNMSAYRLIAPMLLLPPEKLQMPFRVSISSFAT